MVTAVHAKSQYLGVCPVLNMAVLKKAAGDSQRSKAQNTQPGAWGTKVALSPVCTPNPGLLWGLASHPPSLMWTTLDA